MPPDNPGKMIISWGASKKASEGERNPERKSSSTVLPTHLCHYLCHIDDLTFDFPRAKS
jgi:hypothetical protein